jgi:hypothetical protein
MTYPHTARPTIDSPRAIERRNDMTKRRLWANAVMKIQTAFAEGDEAGVVDAVKHFADEQALWRFVNDATMQGDNPTGADIEAALRKCLQTTLGVA